MSCRVPARTAQTNLCAVLSERPGSHDNCLVMGPLVMHGLIFDLFVFVLCRLGFYFFSYTVGD